VCVCVCVCVCVSIDYDINSDQVVSAIKSICDKVNQ